MPERVPAPKPNRPRNPDAPPKPRRPRDELGRPQPWDAPDALRLEDYDNLPLDEERKLETQVLMNYWSLTIRGHDLTARPRRR